MQDMKIYKSIIGVMSEIGAIGKDKTNSQQGFKYRGVDDVMNALQPLLIKNGIFIIPEVVEQTREDKISSKGNALIYSICKVKFTFFADDSSSVTAVTIGEGMDSGDKATNKAMAIAFKYACFQVFCIPTEEMKDADSESHEIKPPEYNCEECGKAFNSFLYNGRTYDAKTAFEWSAKKNGGRSVCRECAKKQHTGGEIATA
jgi:hypothetical protein